MACIHGSQCAWKDKRIMYLQDHQQIVQPHHHQFQLLLQDRETKFIYPTILFVAKKKNEEKNCIQIFF